MPNWCQNTLTVTGEEAAVKAFITENSDPDSKDADARLLSFEVAAPTPAEYLADGDDRWYQWRVNTWGTKWDASVNGAEWEFGVNDEQAATATLDFDTAWSPPVGWLERVGTQHPELLLRLDYVEHGNGFTGYAISEDGYVGDHELEYQQPDDDDEDYYF